ncbi:GTP-binding protein, putative [Plasmodium vivax]|uniref:GTP-binding protein, putative n=1 Tax=Plasmodium vivax TaxID=5855 RepID=A0A565A105_PLAVI|nr:GTP-binding protein, putative [Plasmodium vivax]
MKKLFFCFLLVLANSVTVHCSGGDDDQGVAFKEKNVKTEKGAEEWLPNSDVWGSGNGTIGRQANGRTLRMLNAGESGSGDGSNPYDSDDSDEDDSDGDDSDDDDENQDSDENNFEVPINCTDGECLNSMDDINKIIDDKKKKLKNKKKRGKAVQIIKPNVNHTELIIIEENLEILKSIEKPIAIVSVLGDMHTGKSFLLNLLNEHVVKDVSKSEKNIEKGFKVGNDITASTYGIWIWSEPIKITVGKLKKMYDYIDQNFTNFVKNYEYEKDEYNEEIIDLLNLYKTDDWLAKIDELNLAESQEVNLILMDTQGLNSPNVNKRYDEILYALTNLISTDIIFLTMKMINNKDLEFIENITKDANLFMLRAYTRSNGSTFSIKKNNFDKILDHMESVENNSLILESIASKNLMWVVHDFSQRLDVRKGKLWLDILLNSDRRDLDIKYWKKIISNKSKEKYDAYTTKQRKIAYLGYSDGGASNQAEQSAGAVAETSSNYKLNVLYKNIDCVLLRNMYNNKEFDFTNANLADLNDEYKNDVMLLRYKIYLRALLFPKKMYSNVQMNYWMGKMRKEQQMRNQEGKGGAAKKTTDGGENHSSGSYGAEMSNRYMSGQDVHDFITFLVRSANQNLFTNVNQFFKQFKINRAEISRNDLVFLYKKYLLQFMENEDVEFISYLNDEGDDLAASLGNKFSSHERKSTFEEEELFSEDFPEEEKKNTEERMDMYKLPPLLNEIRKYEELIREQILNIWYKYTESDFHDDEEKELIKDIEANLYERLDQIKNEMVELGEANIKKFCKIACEDALQIVVEDIKMKSDQYPIKQKDLMNFFESVSYNLLKYLEKKLSKSAEKLDLIYYKDEICSPLINSTFQEFYYLKKKNITLNESRLKFHFSNAVSKGKEVFEMLAESTDNITEYFKNKNLFYAILDKWNAEAVNVYMTSLSDFSKEEKEISEEYLIILDNDIKVLKQKAMEKWHNHCKDKTSALFNMHKGNLKKNFLENFNFPLDELVLQDIFLSLKGQEELKYMDIYCSNEESWQGEYKKFLLLTDEVYKFIKDENLKAIQITCQQPLDDLKNGIRHEIKKYYLWRSLKNELYSRALVVLSSNIENIYLKNQRENKIQSSIEEKLSTKNTHYRKISKELMSKVINRWLNNDIYNIYYPIIRKQLIHKIICYLGMLILMFITCVVLYFKKFHISFFFLIIISLFMIFGYAQISLYVKKFFRHVVFYFYEGIANVFGTEGAIIFTILFISVTAIYLYNYHIVRIKNKVAKNTKKIFQSQNLMNLSGVNGFKDMNGNPKTRIFKPNIMKYSDYDKRDGKYLTSNLTQDYKMHNDASQFIDLKSRPNRGNKVDDYPPYSNPSKFQRRSYLD